MSSTRSRRIKLRLMTQPSKTKTSRKSKKNHQTVRKKLTVSPLYKMTQEVYHTSLLQTCIANLSLSSLWAMEFKRNGSKSINLSSHNSYGIIIWSKTFIRYWLRRDGPCQLSMATYQRLISKETLRAAASYSLLVDQEDMLVQDIRKEESMCMVT